MHVNENWCLGVEDGKSTHQIRVHITNLFYDTIKKDLSYYMQLIKEFFFKDKVKKYFTYNIYRNSSNMGRKILFVFLFLKKRYQHYVQYIVDKTNNFFTFLYTKQKNTFKTETFNHTETIYIINKLHQSFGQYSC